MRKSNDKIESIGISKAIEVAQKAKIILYLIEANDNDDDSIKEAFKSFNSENIIIIPIFSKIDLEDKNEKNTVIYQKNKISYLKGIANLGYRPTFSQKKILLEVHIFNFSGNLYNKHLSVEFVKFIRKEKKFKNVSELRKQIRSDLKASK